MKKMQVLSVSLYDYTVRESMRKVDEYLRGGKVSTIAYVSKKGIMEADENEQVKDFLAKMDLLVSADSDILRAANVETKNRLREIDENIFMEEFLKKMVRQRKTIYLMAQTESDLEQLESSLASYETELRIVGRFALENLENDEDFVVNEINKEEPCVLISSLPSIKRIEFYDANHMKLNTNIWLMLKDNIVLHNQRKGLFWKVSDKVVQKIFKRRVLQYQNEKDERTEGQKR